MAHKGHALVGDPVYGRNTAARMAGFGADDATILKACTRQALHAVSLGFEHPKRGEKLVFQSEFPPELVELMAVFERVDAAN
jgi:23S rRNA pseudouridine1911/1915/1917 synthase